MEFLTKKEGLWTVSFQDLIRMSILVAYCMNLLNVGVYIPLFIFPIMCIYLIRFKFNFEFTITLATLTVFSILYAVVHLLYEFSTNGLVLMYLIYPFTLYILGYIATRGEYKKMLQYLALIIIAFTLYGFLNLMNTILIYGNMTSAISAFGGKRLVVNIWDNSFISATGVNTTLSFGLAMLPIIFLTDKYAKKNNGFRIIVLLSFLVATYCILLLGNRTGLGIIVLSFLITTLLVRKIRFKRLGAIATALGSIFILKLLFNSNVLRLRSAWENTLLYSRLHSSELGSDSRFNAWKTTLNGLIDNPMGGKKTSIPLAYSHNLWLDVAYEGGVIPFIVLIIFSVISIVSIIKFQKYNPPLIIKGLVIALITAFFITFMVEPVIQGWFTYFNIFCFIVGMIQRQNAEYRSTRLIPN